MTPELATAIGLVAVMVAVAIIVRNVRDRSARRQHAHRDSATAALGVAAMDPDLVQRRLEGRPAPVGPTRIVVAGARPAIGGAAAAAGMDEPEPPRVQLIRDASAVGIAIIVVLLIGPTILASRTGAVLGETSPPDDAAFPSGELGPSPAAEAPPGSGRLDGEAIPSLVAPQLSPDPGVPGTPGPRPTPNPAGAAARPAPTPAQNPNSGPTPTRRPNPTPTRKPAPTPTPPPDPTPTPPPDLTPTPPPDPTPTPPPDPTPTPDTSPTP